MAYPKAVGAYSVYQEAGDLVFLSGQIPLNPATNTVEAKDIKSQTKQVMENIKGVLDELNLTFANIVKSTCLLADINHFTDFNEIYASYLKEPYPARSAFAVRDLPKGVLIEIEVIAKK